MSPERGPLQSIQVAKTTGKSRKMAAKVDIVDQAYFAKEIEPLIDGKQIRCTGEVGPAEKSESLRHASALLAPIQWEEPFGLFIVEALACGTPVIALERGSVPEIMIDGQTGFIVKTVEDMIKKVPQIETINRAKCRQHVESH